MSSSVSLPLSKKRKLVSISLSIGGSKPANDQSTLRSKLSKVEGFGDDSEDDASNVQSGRRISSGECNSDGVCVSNGSVTGCINCRLSRPNRWDAKPCSTKPYNYDSTLENRTTPTYSADQPLNINNNITKLTNKSNEVGQSKYIDIAAKRLQEATHGNISGVADRHTQELLTLHQERIKNLEAAATLEQEEEHRARAREQLKTAQKSLELTLMNQGKSQLTDYIPRDVLAQFNRQAAAAKARAKIPSDRPSESCVDLKTFQSGPKEYLDLLIGPKESVPPVSAKANSGIGFLHSSTNYVIPTTDDDDVEIFRKRMTLAYKFRPNPMNNPRREY
jgi:hypothetical protein